jgi:predicted nuclease with TOPRIM domain
MTGSVGDELEELQKRKEEMQDRLEAIKRDRLALEERIHVLREKNAIRELEGQMRAEQNVL